MGRGLGYKRKTSHLTIIVTDEGVVPAKRKKKAAVKAPVAPADAAATEEKAPAKKTRKTAVKKTAKKAEKKETAEK